MDEENINIGDNEDHPMVVYTCANTIAPRNLKHVKSLVNFTLKKFFSKYMRDRLDIEIYFKKGLFESDRQYGNCTWEDVRHRPRIFTIEIEPDQPIKLLLNTIAHELVHVKQWAKGEFAELRNASKDKPEPVYKFIGKKFDTAKIDYWDHPWEIEAHGRAIGIVVQWCKKNEYDCKKFVVDG
jgi:hypothetical protein